MTTEIIGIIPARAGSTRVPNKNKVLINGHPMIAYTIESAKQSGVFAKLLLATDDDEIMEIGEHYGVEETYKRGQEDSTSHIDPLLVVSYNHLQYLFSDLQTMDRQFYLL